VLFSPEPRAGPPATWRSRSETYLHHIKLAAGAVSIEGARHESGTLLQGEWRGSDLTCVYVAFSRYAVLLPASILRTLEVSIDELLETKKGKRPSAKPSRKVPRRLVLIESLPSHQHQTVLKNYRRDAEGTQERQLTEGGLVARRRERRTHDRAWPRSLRSRLLASLLSVTDPWIGRTLTVNRATNRSSVSCVTYQEFLAYAGEISLCRLLRRQVPEPPYQNPARRPAPNRLKLSVLVWSFAPLRRIPVCALLSAWNLCAVPANQSVLPLVGV
jgi:hypothetical protein